MNHTSKLMVIYPLGFDNPWPNPNAQIFVVDDSRRTRRSLGLKGSGGPGSFEQPSLDDLFVHAGKVFITRYGSNRRLAKEMRALAPSDYPVVIIDADRNNLETWGRHVNAIRINGSALVVVTNAGHSG